MMLCYFICSIYRGEIKQKVISGTNYSQGEGGSSYQLDIQSNAFSLKKPFQRSEFQMLECLNSLK